MENTESNRNVSAPAAPTREELRRLAISYQTPIFYLVSEKGIREIREQQYGESDFQFRKRAEHSHFVFRELCKEEFGKGGVNDVDPESVRLFFGMQELYFGPEGYTPGAIIEQLASGLENPTDLAVGAESTSAPYWVIQFLHSTGKRGLFFSRKKAEQYLRGKEEYAYCESGYSSEWELLSGKFRLWFESKTSFLRHRWEAENAGKVKA